MYWNPVTMYGMAGKCSFFKLTKASMNMAFADVHIVGQVVSRIQIKVFLRCRGLEMTKRIGSRDLVVRDQCDAREY